MAKQGGKKAHSKAKKQIEIENVGEALSTTEAFIEKNQKQLITAVGVIALLFTLFIALNNMYFKPRAITAACDVFPP